MAKKKVHKKKAVKKATKKKVFKKVLPKRVKVKPKKCRICAPLKRKPLAKKPAKKTFKKPVAVPALKPVPPGVLVGEIIHFYPNISVAVVEVKKNLKKGDKIQMEGKGISFTQTVDSMQMNHLPIEVARKGDAIGMKVAMPVKEKVKVYLVK